MENAFKKYALNTSTQGQTAITSLYQDTENNYWIGSNKGLYFLSLTMVIFNILKQLQAQILPLTVSHKMHKEICY
jgi:ligand-binding sensor domain-containing protein